MTILILGSGNPFIQDSGTICALLVNGMLRKILLDYFEFGPVVLEDVSFKYMSYLEL